MEHDNKVVLVHEAGRASDDIADILRQYHDVELVPLDIAAPAKFKDCLMVVLDVDLSRREVVLRLQKTLESDGSPRAPLLFVLNELRRRDVLQIHSLGSQDFIVRPLREIDVLPVLRSLINGSVESRWNQLSPVQASALKVSLKVFEDMMGQAFAGEPLPAATIRESCRSIIDATAHDDLESWIHAIRDHHNYTFRHSMLVSGILVSFAHLLGIGGEDLQTLALGAMLHDVGKAFTPLDILDKPGQLSDQEWVVMRQHPVDSRKILEREKLWEASIIDVAAHHHEKLDGTGYPDGLDSAQISDFVRMVSIADVFSALVDKRAYKAPKDGRDAYELMLTMDGQLDMDLVKAFEPLAIGMGNRR